MEDHYATLRVAPGASAEEIERAYRRLARANHPDLLGAAPTEERRQAEARLKRVNRAHRILGDRDRRLAYDQERSRRGAAPRRPPAHPPARPAAERTSHWGASGPIDVEWITPPPRAPRPDTDIFSLRRLFWGAALIVVFTLILMLLWDPVVGQAIPTPLP